MVDPQVILSLMEEKLSPVFNMHHYSTSFAGIQQYGPVLRFTKDANTFECRYDLKEKGFSFIKKVKRGEEDKYYYLTQLLSDDTAYGFDLLITPANEEEIKKSLEAWQDILNDSKQKIF